MIAVAGKDAIIVCDRKGVAIVIVANIADPPGCD